MPPTTPLAFRHVLSIGGTPSAVEYRSGGGIRGDVVSITSGADRIPRKQIAAVLYEPFVLDVGLSMGQPFRDWITGSLAQTAPTLSGTLITVDQAGRAQRSREFMDALIEEVTLPTLDAASRTAGELTVKIRPELIKYLKGDGAIHRPSASPKQWITSNFKMSLGNLPCKRVAKVDSVTIKQSTTTPGRLEIPNLRVTFSIADAPAWEDWFEDFVVDGQNAQTQELQGQIQWLDATLQGMLATVALSHVGICALDEVPGEGSERAPSMVAELYVESLSLAFAGS